MNVLVTGATGFIGNYVVRKLLSMGVGVTATSRDEVKAREAEWFPHVNYIPFDLATIDLVTDYYSFFKRPDLLIHLAWEGLPNYTAPFHEEVNLPRHQQLLYNLIENGLPDLTVTGTCFEYGLQEGSLNEQLPAIPVNSYGRAKNRLRIAVEEKQREYAFAFKWVRLFYMYGKGQNPNSLLSQLDRALENSEPVFNMSGGQQLRDFLPVETVATYIVQIALQKKVTGIVNCCSGLPVSVLDFVNDYLKKIDRTISLNKGHYPYAPYEPMRFWGDDTKLKAILNNG